MRQTSPCAATRRAPPVLAGVIVFGVALLISALLVAAPRAQAGQPHGDRAGHNAHGRFRRSRPSLSAHAAVVGGATADAGTWPWLAFVADTQTDTGCSGTVISPMIVLTAAHCVEDITSGVVQPPSAFEVVTGRLDWTDTSGGQLLAVARVIVHPGYTLTTFGTDAAVLVLATPTEAPAIALATPASSALRNPGAPGAMAGWGDTYGGEATPPTALHWASTVVQSPAYCATQEALDAVAFDPQAAFCAIDPPSFATAACHGDSGGPLIASGSATPIEIGITSRGDSNCDARYPTVFTAVDTISAWADQWIASYPPPPPPPALIAQSASPPAPPAPSPPTHAFPPGGLYRGRTGQHHGRFSATLAPHGAGLTRLVISFTLHCRRPPARRYTQAVSWKTPFALTAGTTSANLWTFATQYSDTAHWRYAVTGHFQTAGTASGTLDVTSRNGRCTTGRTTWTARH